MYLSLSLSPSLSSCFILDCGHYNDHTVLCMPDDSFGVLPAFASGGGPGNWSPFFPSSYISLVSEIRFSARHRSAIIFADPKPSCLSQRTCKYATEVDTLRVCL